MLLCGAKKKDCTRSNPKLSLQAMDFVCHKKIYQMLIKAETQVQSVSRMRASFHWPRKKKYENCSNKLKTLTENPHVNSVISKIKTVLYSVSAAEIFMVRTLHNFSWPKLIEKLLDQERIAPKVESKRMPLWMLYSM